MTEPYTRASELKDFVFCNRAWFLEGQGVDTELTDARELGTADHLHRATAVRRGRLEYRNRTLDIPFDSALRAALLETLRDLHPLRGAHTVRRNHSSAASCRGCGFRHQCSDSLAQ
jgi:CRISPR/Cas system-associated exonuclease Cas4 (RecB family)